MKSSVIIGWSMYVASCACIAGAFMVHGVIAGALATIGVYMAIAALIYSDRY